MISIVGYAVAVAVGLILGAAASWFRCRSLMTVLERAKSEAAIELASLRERVSRAQELERRLEQSAATEQSLRDEVLRLSQEQAQLATKAQRIPELEQRAKDLEAQVSALRDQLTAAKQSLSRVSAELDSEREGLRAVRAELEKTQADLKSAERTAAQLAAEKSDLTTRLEAEQKLASEKLELLNEARRSLSDQFKALANDILEEKSKKFVEQNQTNLGQLLEPLRSRLVEFQAKVEDVYVKETEQRSALGEQVRQLMALNQSLSDEAKNLTQALKGSSKVQGNYGELVLERVLESSGLRKGEEYQVQAAHVREDGSRAQPDVVIRLPENRSLVVDSKVSLVAYEESVSAQTEEDRAAAIQRHIASVRAHIRSLSDKNYQSLYQLNSLDFVLMFIPIEPAFMLAVTHDRDLFMEAWNRNVLLVSPSTLMFVVRTVAHLWRQEAQSRNAQEIAKRGAELYDRLCAFVADLEKVGDRLRQAQDSFNEARDKLSKNKGNVIRQAEMLKRLGVKPAKSLPQSLVETALGAEPEAGPFLEDQSDTLESAPASLEPR